jgi:hypothetical protein
MENMDNGLPKDGKVTIEYDSNNSGGTWWLDDKDWAILSTNGWVVVPVSSSYIGKNNAYALNSSGIPMFTRNINKMETFLGTKATTAFKRFYSVEDAEQEFELLLGKDPEEEGCSCCGRPHNFGVVSGSRDKLFDTT